MEKIAIKSYFRANMLHEEVDTYNIWGAIITEVEVDMLTGEKNILR